jgi:hypothetical protein
MLIFVYVPIYLPFHSLFCGTIHLTLFFQLNYVLSINEFQIRVRFLKRSPPECGGLSALVRLKFVVGTVNVIEINPLDLYNFKVRHDNIFSSSHKQL